MTRHAYVIGSGPNGLTAAIVLAHAGLSVTVLEAQPTIGGGTRSAALTLPGFVHDVCSAVHPLAVCSPAFASFPLAAFGLEWIQPPIPLAHALDGGTCARLDQCIERTARGLGIDGPAWTRLATPLVNQWGNLIPEVLGPPHIPRHPFLLARFGALALWPATVAARSLFRTPEARALFAGIAAHSMISLDKFSAAAFAWMLGLAGNAVGWPIPRGGSQTIANALAGYLQSLGGRIVANANVSSLNELRDADAVLCDVTPRQFLRLAGDRLPDSYRRSLENWRYGPGVFKIDWALNSPIPWSAGDCARAGTVHLGGTLEEIAESERKAWDGIVSDRPFVLLAQQSLFDRSRAPQGKHTGWGYCHVPNGSTEDMTERIEAQVERFAPGFRATILARHTMNTADAERHNANLIGGDIGGGAAHLPQLFRRPTWSFYNTPLRGVYLCSASTPPGAGVHGMCGWHAARTALAHLRL
ncbi:MAG TPA: NAD(P)/FAD-dependent oxidoreductase [Bryobacteraceae bacterium]|nr:NAD(P)/FAD-dependent oxidoreductase [Bryobacteraceae bacterium]